MKKLFYLSVIALTAFAVSCTNGGDDSGIVPPGKKVSVNLKLDIAPVIADGQPAADERTSLNNVWILMFDESGTNIFAQKESRFDTGKPVSTEIIAGNDLDIYAVANVDAGTVFQLGKMTHAEFLTALNSTVVTSAESIPHSGKSLTTTVNRENQDITVNLTRIAAKMSFKFTYAGEGYTVKSVAMKNVAKYPYYISQGENTSWGPDAFKEVSLTVPFDQQYIHYIGENLMGTESGITSAKDKATNRLATHIEITAEKPITDGRIIATFRFYPGDNPTTDFNVKRNNEYVISEAVDFSDETDKRITRVTKGTEREVPEANCYMIEPLSMYEIAIPVTRVNKFWASGEGNNNLNNVINDGANGGKVDKWKARVMKSSAENLIAFVKDSGESAQETMILKASDSGNKGNALIGIFDATGGEPAADAKPLWSWHIWVTDYVPGGMDDESKVPVVESNPGRSAVPGGAVVLFGNIADNIAQTGGTAAAMDRNLGALSANHQDGLETFGLFYQWGRKDPFFTEFDINDYDINNQFSSVQAIHNTSEGKFTIGYSVQNPLTFITSTLGEGEWIDIEGYNTLWYNAGADAQAKTIYDPCPPGWRVPWTANALAGARMDNSLWSDMTGALPIEQWGWYAMNETANCYFPMTGGINGGNGKIGSIGINTPIWTASATGNRKNAYITRFVSRKGILDNEEQFDDGGITYNYNPPAEAKTGGKPVRCVKE